MRIETQDFSHYQRELEDKIDKVLGDRAWGRIIPTLSRGGLKKLVPLLKHLTVVVNNFLESDSGESALFIKLPVEELAIGDKEQLEAYNCLSGVVLGCLATATSQEFKQRVRITLDSHILVEDSQYKVGDKFCCLTLKGQYLYSEVISREEGGVRLKFREKSNPKQAFAECKKDTFIRIDDFPVQERNGFKKICDDAQLVDDLPHLSKDYSKACMVVSYSPNNPKIPSISTHLIPPYICKNSFEDIDSCREILVFVGDKTYKDSIQSIYNEEAKKVIFIGSEFPNERRYNPKRYEFSHRELYRIINPTEKFRYPEIISLEFPWLEKVRLDLDNLLSNYKGESTFLEESMRKKITCAVLSRMVDADFNQDKLNVIREEFDEYSPFDSINGLNLSDDEYDELANLIQDWLQDLSFENEVNPKESWLRENLGSSLHISNGFNQPKRAIRRHSIDNNTFVISSRLSIYHNDISSLSLGCILRNRINPRIKVLYYKGLEDARRSSLERYIESEYLIYCSELRKRWTCKFTNSNEIRTVDTKDWEIEELRTLDEVSNESPKTRVQLYSVTCCNGEQLSLKGDVLLYVPDQDDWERCSLDGLSIKDGESVLIRYYQQPESFDDFIDEEQKKLVGKAAALWREQYQNEYKTLISREREESVLGRLKQELKMGEPLIRSYAEDKNDNKFLRSRKGMRRMCEWLIGKGRIKKDDAERVMFAQRINAQNVGMGKKLKEALIEYGLTGSVSDWLKEQENINIEELYSQSIIEVKVTQITRKQR